MHRARKQPTITDEPKLAVVPAEAVSDASEGEDLDRDYETILTTPETDVHWVKAKTTYLGPATPRVVIDLVTDEG